MKKWLLSLVLIFTAMILVACDNSSDPIDEEEPPVIELPELTADDSKANLGTSRKLAVEWDLVEDEVTFMSSDETKATVSTDGVVEFKGLGFVVITAATKNGDVATFIIEVFDVVVVKAGTKTDDSVIVDGLEVFYGEKLVDNLADAEDLLSSTTTLHIKSGTYDTEFAITVDGLKMVTDENVIITRPLIVDAKNIKIENFNFTNEGLITSTLNAENLVIKNNKFDHVSNNAISLYNSEGVLIEGNEFNDIDGAAISIVDFKKGQISINKNIIKNVKDGIHLESNQYDETTSISIQRNELENFETGFTVLLDDQEISAIVRFNALKKGIESYMAKSSNSAHRIDFTLNYWGEEELNPNMFINIPELMLIGNYPTKESIIGEGEYNSNQPLFFFITNPVETLDVRDTYKLEWIHLPYELPQANVQFLTSQISALTVDNQGNLKALRSGLVKITVRSVTNNKIKTELDISVLTDPGIELTPETKEQQLLKGDSIKLTALPFPYTLSDEEVIFTSSDSNIASVDETGLVRSFEQGTVTITAKLASDSNIQNTYTLSFYDALDENNLMDLLTMYQVHYSKLYNYTVTGIGDPYLRADQESVSKYYFDNLVINEMLVPLDGEYSSGTRGAQSRPDLPEGYTSYNPQNIYWVVVHDTAVNTHVGQAQYYAQYLVNKALNGPSDSTSWHYTIDDSDIYRHIPEDEVAWHAGDGSTRPGEGSYTGGGNRNGIGIETATSIGQDIYRVWQRTAKFAGDALVRNNLPRENVKFHRDFSGKNCPQVLIASGLMPYFHEFVDVEYKVAKNFADPEILFESLDLDILDNHGRILSSPDHARTVSYRVTVTFNGVTESRVFYTHIPGSLR